MDLDRFSRPMAWERKWREPTEEELDEYKEIRDRELEEKQCSIEEELDEWL